MDGMGFRVCSLSSGSDGNATYLSTGCTHVLVDAGLTLRDTLDALKSIGVSPYDLDAILISHEHADHIRGVGALSRKFDIPVYANQGTWEAMQQKVGDIASRNVRIFYTGMDFYINDMNIQSYAVPHDAAEPVGFCFYNGNKKISIVTDLGHTNTSIIKMVQDSDLILLEANHDVHMLQMGPYPWPLKKRIMGKYGHLSNEQAGMALVDMLKDRTMYVLLAHLSQENNLPALAYETVTEILLSNGIKPGKDVVIDLTYRDGISGFYHVE